MRDCLKKLIKNQRLLVQRSRELVADLESLKGYREVLAEAKAVLREAESRQGKW